MRRGALVAFTLAALATAGCEDPPTECGPGTEEREGVCVVLREEVRCGDGTAVDAESGECVAFVRCGADTVFDADTGECAPASECGPGTFLDLATGECLPEQSCGAGTELDEDTGECVPTLDCGPGTELDQDADECVPAPACQDGSVRDPDTGLCVSDLTCGPDQTLVSGVCVEPGDEAVVEADVFESLPDVNDPDSGGAPESIVLEPVGERVVFLGNIDRPSDTSGAGTLRQDRDLWRFTGAAGQLLHIEVRDLGLPEPAFLLEGPSGYARRSASDGDAAAERVVLLPYDGEYTLTIVPSSFLATGIPLGDPAAGYVGVVEELPWPAETAVFPMQGAANADALSGDLTDLRDNIFNVQAAPGTPFLVVFRAVGDGTVPAAVALTGTGEPLGHVQDLGEDGFLAGVTGANGRAVVVLDWQELDPLDATFEVALFTVPVVDRGSLPPDFNTVTADHDLVAGEDGAAFRFAVEERQIALADLGGSGLFNPDVQVVGPGGTRADVRDDDELFFFAEPGVYFVIVYNDNSSDDQDVSLTLELRTPWELAAGDAWSDPVGGTDLLWGFSGFPDAWAVVTPDALGLLELSLLASDGDPDIYVHRMNGELVRAVHRPHLGLPVHARIPDGRPLLVRIDADGENLIGWTLAARRVDNPAVLDVEPNDTRANATPLPALPAITRGHLGDGEVDVFRFELDAPLLPGEAIEVLFDNLDGDSGYSQLSDGAYVSVRDAAYAPLPSLPLPESSPGVLGSNAAALVPAYEGAGPFYVVIEEGLITSEAEYVLRVRTVALTGEVEPNDTVDDADLLGALPAHRFAYRDEDDPADVYRFQLDEALGADESIRVRFRNAESNVKLDVTLETLDGQVLVGQSRVLGELRAPALAAGEYVIRVTEGTGGEPLYRLDVEIAGVVESEPNDTLPEAHDLGALAAGGALEVVGYAADTEDDVFLFTAPDVPDDESLLLTVVNIDDNSKNEVEWFDESAFVSGDPFAHDADVASTLIARRSGAGPFAVRVRGATAVPDRYRLRVERGGAAELEPNEGPETASPVPAIPGRVLGTISGGETDVWIVPAALVPFGSVMRARLENESDGSSIHFSLRGDDFDTVGADGTGFRVTLQTGSVGPFYLVVQGTGDPELASDVYSIDLEVTP